MPSLAGQDSVDSDDNPPGPNGGTGRIILPKFFKKQIFTYFLKIFKE